MSLLEQHIKEIIHTLLEEIEEEDIGISLFTTHYQNEDELSFFDEKSKKKVRAHLERLSSDSKRHKELISEIVNHLVGKLK